MCAPKGKTFAKRPDLSKNAGFRDGGATGLFLGEKELKCLPNLILDFDVSKMICLLEFRENFIMKDTRSLDDLKVIGAGKRAPEEVEALYRQAFRDFGALALWSSRPRAHPTAADALAITRSLRVEGNREARQLAERIEDLCRAAL